VSPRAGWRVTAGGRRGDEPRGAGNAGTIGGVITCAPNAPLATRRACSSASHALGSSSVARGRAEVAAAELKDEDAGSADDARVATQPRPSTVLGVRSSMLRKLLRLGHTRTVVGWREVPAESDTACVARCTCLAVTICSPDITLHKNVSARCASAAASLCCCCGPGLCATGPALAALCVYTSSARSKGLRSTLSIGGRRKLVAERLQHTRTGC
jgi:hypothetical protein